MLVAQHVEEGRIDSLGLQRRGAEAALAELRSEGQAQQQRDLQSLQAARARAELARQREAKLRQLREKERQEIDEHWQSELQRERQKTVQRMAELRRRPAAGSEAQ